MIYCQLHLDKYELSLHFQRDDSSCTSYDNFTISLAKSIQLKDDY